MIAMIDQIFDRTYQSGRAQLNAAIGHGFKNVAKAVADTFAVLNRIEYSAPWTASTKAARIR
jgi:hypothetical protein